MQGFLGTQQKLLAPLYYFGHGQSLGAGRLGDRSLAIQNIDI